MKEIPEIVLTGGPCAGKTTGLARVQSWLMDRGFRAFLAPEVATMFIQGGVSDIGNIAERDLRRYLHFQKEVLAMQMDIRNRFRSLAEGFTEPSVIIYDRGPMDGCAYLEKLFFNAIMNDLGLTLHDVRDSFSAVMHLVTAANGAENYYTTANNEARHETIDQARALDQKTQNAWVGHPHVKIIGNDPPGFDSKIRRLIAAIARVLGIPVPLEIEHKFLLRRIPDISRIPGVQAVEIEQMYLGPSRGERVRIRKRTAIDGSSTYYQTIKTKTGRDSVRNERENVISAMDYAMLSALREQGTAIIHKTRHCFLWNQQYFELDVFQNPSGRVYLEIELTEANDAIDLPPFVDVDRDVTEELGFSNYDLVKNF